MGDVIELHPTFDCKDIVKCLRNIADDIEKGEYHFKPTMGTVILAREEATRDREGPGFKYEWCAHGLGDCTYFQSKGLMAAALANFDGRNHDD